MKRTEAPTIHISTPDPGRFVAYMLGLGFVPWWLSRLDDVVEDATFGITVEGYLPLLIEVSRKVAPAVFQLEDVGADTELLELARRIPRLVLEAAAANPHGFDVVAHALAGGEGKHPGRGLGPSPDQLVVDHLAALQRHAHHLVEDVPGGVVVAADQVVDFTLAIDPDTGLPNAGLVAARGILAIQRADVEAREAEHSSAR